MKTLTVRLTRNGQIVEEYNELGELQVILRRNYDKSEPIGNVTGKVLRIARDALKKCDVFEAVFNDRSECRFILYGGKVDALEAQGWRYA